MAEQQLVDADGEFSGTLSIPSGASTSVGYGVVAVIGCQSGGKSTLLNAAFGTRFPVLDAAVSGRRRTTLGVWGAVAPAPRADGSGSGIGGGGGGGGGDGGSAPVSPLVVLDVEGADSRERGDGARAFESRTALLALALADVVVVNMWAHDVGRHSAANYDLFETVFAHAARLRAGGALPGRVSVLIAVRDHDAHAPLDHIRRILLGDLEAIWDALRIRGAEFADLFSFEFAALPHKKYAPDAFADAVAALAGRVRETAVAEAGKDVPLAAFEALAAAVWEEVCEATGGADGSACALDLPKHAALASHYQVGRIAQKVLDGSVTEGVDALRDEIEAEWRTPLERFDVRVAGIVHSAFVSFDEAAAPFASSASGAPAVEARRNELGVSLVSHMNDLRDRYLWVCRESSLAAFEDEFRPMLGGTNGFARSSRRLANKYIDKYKRLLDLARYPDALAPFLDEREAAVNHEDLYDGAGSDPASDEAGVEDDNVPAGGGPLLVGGEQDASATFAALAALDEDTDDEAEDEFALERFTKDLHRMIDERKRLGELMLPGPLGAAAKQPPWWKGILIRGVILLINYLQASQGHRAALRLQRQHEKDFPHSPTF